MKTVNEIMMGFGNGTPTVEQMYSIRDRKEFMVDDEVTKIVKAFVDTTNDSSEARISLEYYAVADESTVAHAEGNEWYTIPREGCKGEYWFLLVLGKNGGTKSFASEILDPVSTLLKTLEVDGCVFPDIVDVSLDNADDLHYFVIHTSK